MKLTDQFPAFPALRKPVPNGLIPEGAGLPPFGGNLNTLHKTVNGNNWLEELAGLPGSILPRIYSGDGVGHYRKDIGNPFSSDDFVFYLSLASEYIIPPVSIESFFSQSTGCYIRLESTGWRYQLYDSTNFRTGIIPFATLPLEKRVYNFKMVQDKDLSLKIYESDNLLVTNIASFTNAIGAEVTFGSTLSALIISSNISLISATLYSDLSETNLVFDYIFKGDSYIYDLSNNSNHLDGVNITSSNVDYSLNGSLYPLLNGLSMYSNIAGDLIRVPYDINGLPLVSPPVPAGYTLRSEHPASVGNLNMFDCLVDFANVGDNPDIIINGSFSTDSDWAKTGESEINSGSGRIYSSAGAISALGQLALTTGKTYQLCFDIISSLNGSIKIQDGFQVIASSINNITSHCYEFTAKGPSLDFLRSSGITDVRIDNVTLKEIDNKLNNFVRSNEIIYNNDARAGSDYDLGHTLQFQIDNLDPRILFTWRNVGHKGMLYAKIYLDVNKNIIRILEMLNYLSDHVDAEEYQIMIYCGYESIIIVDEFGDYLIDGDDYVLIEGL